MLGFPLMFFIDKTHTVEKGKYTMAPVLTMSLGIFSTINVRNNVNAWRLFPPFMAFMLLLLLFLV